MKNDRSKDKVELLGEYLRDRKPSHEEERSVLDHVWKDLCLEGERVPERVLRDFKPARTGSAGRLLWVGATAALVFAVVLSGVLIRGDSPGLVASIDGALERVYEKGAQPIQAGEKLAFGEVVRSGRGTSAVLTLNDGSEIEMRSNSELALEKADDGVRIRLDGGGILVIAARQRTGHLYVQTKDATVSVIGTVFLVNAEEAGSRVAVIQGEVHVQQGATSQKLLPGEQVATNPLMESRPVIEQVSWSRSAEAQLALLRQSAAVPKRLEFEVASLRLGESLYSAGPTRVRCKGIDGELNPAPASAPAVPQGRCVGDHVPLITLIATAYGIAEPRISGLPFVLDQPAYRIDAKAEDPSKATKEELRQMLRNLLIERLKLNAHLETKEAEGYILLVGKDGVKFKETSGDEEMPQSRPAGPLDPQQLDARQVLSTIMKGKFALRRFAEFLSVAARLPVIDKTGLSGIYDIAFTFDLILPPGTSGVGGRGSVNTAVSQEFATPLPKALEDQLGLRLESAKVPVEYLVVDHIEKATEN